MYMDATFASPVLSGAMDPKNRSESRAKAVTEEVESDGTGADLPIPSSSWTVSVLREYLKSVGGLISGRKAELLERAIFYDKNPDAAKGKRWAKGDRTACLV